ncbi:hypothetical protein Peur_032095 [Populus x canadensis]
MQTSTLKAGIANFDEYWKKRAEEAKEASREAYEPNPEKVTKHFNDEVHKSLEGRNSTRRNLGKNKGPCLATNPIDRCWRCDKNWAKNRKKLGGCALGFGRKTIGGKHGKYYRVTDPSDNDMVNPKAGTLRYGVIQDKPLWIIFAHDMVIRLSEELMVASNKTIDGRGANVHIYNGAQITLQFVKNVIIHGIHIHDAKAGNGGMIRDSVDHYGFRSRSDGDGISIFGSTDIWIDHISMSNCEDGLIDAIMGSNAITISNCHFTKHNDVTKRDYAVESVWKSWNWRSEGDLMLNGAFFVQSGNAIKTMNKQGVINAKPGRHVSMLTRFSGALDCIRGRPC